MAKGQKRSNKEAKKPKQDKAKAGTGTSPLTASSIVAKEKAKGWKK